MGFKNAGHFVVTSFLIDSSEKKQFGVNWIQFIDCGGQPQYHDILPFFIQNTLTVTIFALKLSEALSHHPTVEYYEINGKSFGKPFVSPLSHEQILQHCLGSMCSPNAHTPLIIIVGTHRDEESKFTESIEEKNQKLKALLGPNIFNTVYNGEDLNDLIFPINAKSPDDNDRKTATKMREKLISKLPSIRIQVPMAWYGLEVELQRSSQDGVLSLVECKACAERLHIHGEVFSAALDHLVQHSVFLYYPDVLPQTVFCDPQAILTKVTELVQYHHKLMDNPDKDVAAESDLVMFRDRGLVSVKLLKKFPKHYKEGLFTPQDLLKLLVSVHVIAMIRDGEYLMPALLTHLGCGKVFQLLHQITSLIIRPTQGCIPSGLFCCLVAHLLSPTNQSPWNLCMEEGKPLCLHRNCISLKQKGTAEIVTLVDMFFYIEVHVSEASSEVCREIRDHVHSGIKSACSVLKYQDVKFEDAFICAGASCTSHPPHVAVVCSKPPRGPVYKWQCTIKETQNGNLSENQLMWLNECNVTKQALNASGG